MKNPKNIAPQAVQEALLTVMEHLENGFNLAVSKEGCIGGEGISWGEFAQDHPSGVGAARDLSLLASLEELRQDWEDGIKTVHTFGTREAEYPDAASRDYFDK